jgi:hypothetical protein
MADTRFKAENGILAVGNTSANSIFDHQVKVNANLTVQDLLLVSGNFTVQGTTTYIGGTLYDVDLVPTSNGVRSVGTAGNTFLGNFYDLTIYNSLVPSANNKALGSTTKRWDTYSNNISSTGTLQVQLSGQFSNTLAVTGAATFSNTVAVTGAVTFSNSVTLTSNITSNGLVLPNGGIFTNTASINSTTATIVDAFPKTLGSAAKVVLAIANSSSGQQAIEILLVHDGSSVVQTQYADVYNTKLGSFDTAINNANVEIKFTSLAANATTNVQTVKIIRQQML